MKKDNADLAKQDKPWIGIITKDGRSIKVLLSMIDTPTALNRWNKELGANYTYDSINPTTTI